MKEQADQLSEETLAIEELYIQLRAMKKILEEKGILSEDDFRVSYARETQVSPGEQASQRLTVQLADHRKKFLYP
jgi:hypothetical protein